MTMHKPIMKTAAESELAAQFAARPKPDTARAAAFAAFAAAGLPTRRLEAWHYTDLRAAMQSAAPPASAPDLALIEAARPAIANIAKIGALRIVMLDGYFAAALSDALPHGVVMSASAQFYDDVASRDAVLALNRAFAPGQLSLEIAAGAALSQSIEILHFTSAGAAKAIYSRASLRLGQNSSARLIERFIGANSADQRNAAMFVEVAQGASAMLATSIEGDCALHLESQIVRLAQGAQFKGFALVAGGALTRRQIFATLNGLDGKISLGGLSLLDGARHADTTLLVDHAAAGGQSREFYKHIVADTAAGVYQGKVVVRPGAQKTDGGMKSQAILISPDAIMQNKPELEIFADDVVCGHGATVGALDTDQVFYLQARGIPRAQAEAILLEGFGAEAIDRYNDAEAGPALKQIQAQWLARRATGPAS